MHVVTYIYYIDLIIMHRFSLYWNIFQYMSSLCWGSIERLDSPGRRWNLSEDSAVWAEHSICSTADLQNKLQILPNHIFTLHIAFTKFKDNSVLRS